MSVMVGYRPDMKPNYTQADILEYQQVMEEIENTPVTERYDAAKECVLDAVEKLHEAMDWLQDAADNLNGLSHEGEMFDYMNQIDALIEPLEKLAQIVGKETE